MTKRAHRTEQEFCAMCLILTLYLSYVRPNGHPQSVLKEYVIRIGPLNRRGVRIASFSNRVQYEYSRQATLKHGIFVISEKSNMKI